MNLFLLLFCIFLEHVTLQELLISPELTKIWGPGLKPNIYIMPARYFFVQIVDVNDNNITSTLKIDLDIHIEGISQAKRPCRLTFNLLNRLDGSYIVRYKLYEPCYNVEINVKYNNTHLANSPYVFQSTIYSEGCACPIENVSRFIHSWKCNDASKQLFNKLKEFGDINWNKIRGDLIKTFDKPHSVSLCHYVVKNNDVFRKCYGKYVGFNMFMDSILLSLSRKVLLPDLEFFVNLGDWPLSTYSMSNKYPILSWCGSTDSFDIIMPTYDITEATLENMGRVMLDMLSVQGSVKHPWEKRIPKLFWRGRDSNRQRLDLVTLSKEHPDLFNVSLTNFFFFKDDEHLYGPKTEHVSFYSFFEYKYQLAIDGTVAPYRLAYLLGGGSLLFKQDSKYYEHFYNELKPYKHYIPVKRDLSDLIHRLKWAVANDAAARTIAKAGQKFANENLLPINIFCDYAQILSELSKKIVSPIVVLEEMEKVNYTQQSCDCQRSSHEEL